MLTEYIEDTSSPLKDENYCFHIPIQIRGDGASLCRQPVQFGVCLPEGLFTGAVEGDLYLIESNEGIPVQIQPLVKHPDGSHQWLLIDAILPGAARYAIGAYVSLREADSERENVIDSGAEAFVINQIARPLRLSLQHGQLSLEELSSSEPVFRQTGLSVEFTGKNGRVQRPVWNSIRQESAGCVRNTYLIEGVIGHRNSRLNVKVRLSFYCRTGLIKIEVCLHNPRRARHAPARRSARSPRPRRARAG